MAKYKSTKVSITQYFFELWTNLFLGLGDFVDEVDDADVGNAAVGFQAHLAGAAIAVTHLDAVVLQLTAQFP